MNNDDYKMKNVPVCQIDCIHEELVEEIKKEIPKDEILYDLSDFFKTLGDSTRMKILFVLFKTEMCVCDIAKLIGMTQSAVSHQLRVLKQARLIKFRKEGKIVYYSLDDEHVKQMFDQGLEHILEKYIR